MTNYEGREILDEDELHDAFVELFPQGWCGADVMAELAPDGWEKSPLLAVYHPSAKQVYEESVRMHRNLLSLPFKRKDDAPPPPPEPTLEQIEAEHVMGDIEPERECQELVGRCLWDLFSDNHEVTDAEGRLLDLGSMRASGGFLAEVVNRQGGPKPIPRDTEFDNEMFNKMFTPDVLANPKYADMVQGLRKEMFGDGGYTYMDFYMGTGMVSGRADLGPVYRMIFKRLKARGMDWKYTFPRLYAVDMRPLGKALNEQKRQESGETEDFEEYDPSAEFEKMQEEEMKDREVSELRESLDESYRESVAEAQDRAPPLTVQMYEEVYGDDPVGWPPEVQE